MRIKKRKYEGFSLVEMLITLALLGFIMVLVAVVLTTMIKVAAVTNTKNMARNDVNYITEFVTKSLSNTHLSEIYLYNSVEGKFYDATEGRVVGDADYSDFEFIDGMSGNELHVDSFNYGIRNCYGFFKDSEDSERGYFLKSTAKNVEDPADCFSEDYAVVVLHSFEVIVRDFRIDYVLIGSDTDNMFIINVTVQPSYWPTSFKVPVNREITRQTTVGTQGLTWF
jgi:prepilin-type N-terminal cleavage/methylation domain-containing protein